MRYAGTEQEVREFVALRIKLLGAPRPGENVGGGRHVEIAMEWDGEGAKPIGWWGDDGPTLERGEWTAPVNKEFAQAESGKNDARLTGQERARFAQSLARVADVEPALAGEGPQIKERKS